MAMSGYPSFRPGGRQTFSKLIEVGDLAQMRFVSCLSSSEMSADDRPLAAAVEKISAANFTGIGLNAHIAVGE